MRCCKLNCYWTAAFEIYPDSTHIHPADGFTHACEAHVGDMLGSPMDGPNVNAWNVYAL